MRSATDRGAAPDALAIAAHRVAAQQRNPVLRGNLLQAFDKARVIIAEHVRNENADRLRSLGGKVGEIHRDQLPGDIRRILPFEDMDAFDHGIVREHQRFATELDDCGVVLKPPSFGTGRQRAQRGDEIALVQRPTSFATASRIPLTNFASRSSKKALATSTYSLIEVALVTSCRASSS